MTKKRYWRVAKEELSKEKKERRISKTRTDVSKRRKKKKKTDEEEGGEEVHHRKKSKDAIGVSMKYGKEIRVPS